MTRALHLTTLLLCLAACAEPPAGPAVNVHYLGHAAFLLEFPTGLTVLTDYGESHAYGLDSPVYDVGIVRPDVVTRSHEHADHAGGQLPDGVGTVLTGVESFEAKGVRITAIPTFEAAPDRSDNVSFLLEYGDLKILHLGDCQALILHAAEPAVRERIRQMYPDTYDLVLLPIGFISDILGEAAEFATLIDARHMVPMHYWSPADRDAFLDSVSGRSDARGRSYRVRVSPDALLGIGVEPGREREPAIIGLTPAPLPERRGPYLGEPEPTASPTVFAPGIVSTIHWEHSAPAFSPNGDEVYWTEISDRARIRVSVKEQSRWSPAALAPWSGVVSDFYPSPSADGRRVYFSSYRAWHEGTANPGYGITMWYVDRTPSGWSDPVRLEAVATGNEFGFSLAADGTLYFTRAIADSFRIHRADPRGSGYAEPVLLPPEINAAMHQDGPYITPDGHVLLFESMRPDGFGGADLYVSLREAPGTWSPAVNLGPAVNTPAAERFARLSNDGRYLFFGSDRNGDRADVFWVRADAVEPLRKALAGR